MKNKLFIYCVVAICVIAITHNPTKCYAGISVFNNGIYNEQHEHAIFEGKKQQHSMPLFETFCTQSPLSGQLLRPFGETHNALVLPIERQNGEGTMSDIPDGDATDEIPVGDGLFVIFLFFMLIIGTRMARKGNK